MRWSNMVKTIRRSDSSRFENSLPSGEGHFDKLFLEKNDDIKAGDLGETEMC